MRRAAALAAFALVAVPGSAAAPQGGTLLAYVSDEHANRLLVVNPITGARRRAVAVPPGPHNVAATRDGRIVLVTSPPAGALTLVDSRAEKVVATLRRLASPHDVEVSPDGRWAYVTEERGARVAVVSLTRRRVVRRVRVPAGPHDLAVRADGKRVWVTHGPRAPALTILDTTRPARAFAAGRTGAYGTHDISFEPTGLHVWLTYWNTRVIGRMRAYSRRGDIHRQEVVGTQPHHVLATGGAVWVTDHGAPRAFVLDPRGGRIRTVQTGPAPHHVDVEAGVAVVVGSTGTLTVYREQTLARIRTIRLGEHLHGVALVFNP